MTLDRTGRRQEMREWYQGEQWRCRAFETKLVERVQDLLSDAELSSPTVESRTKSMDSFLAKAAKPDPTDHGQFKYANPETEITDTIGVRIVVPLSTDVPPIRALIHHGFTVVEELEPGTEYSVDVPGYQSVHLLVRLTENDRQLPRFRDFADLVAEVQIRTTLQHAWASLQHDMNYKADHPPTPSVKRRLVALAGLLELADREFTQVRRDHSDPTVTTTHTGTVPGSEAVSAASLRLFVDQLVGDTDNVDQAWFLALESTVSELGLTSISEIRAALGAWRDRAAEVQGKVLVRKPFANAARLLDELLRLSMGSDYFDRRSKAKSPRDLVASRAQFDAEVAESLRELAV